MNQLSKEMIEQIFSMHKAGHTKSAIARSLGITRNTVRSYLSLGASEALKPAVTKTVDWAERLDWDRLHREFKSGVTFKQLYRENDIPVTYEQFTKQLRARAPVPLPPIAPALRHDPGERTQIDYADGIWIVDRQTGQRRRTHLFCGVLPFSGKTFAEFVWDQKLPNFIRSHEKMWAYFGGVTPYVVIDNLKAGVTKAHRFDPDINPTYCDYANHTGFGVLPARPATPRDKASVEATIGAIQRDFYQQVRNETFYELESLNARFRPYLDGLNDRAMAEHGVSRNERFANERSLLRPLPLSPYVFSEWTEATVHPDCCIQVQKGFYSVPFQHVGQQVRVKLTDKTVTIFSMDMTEIAFHTRVALHKKSLTDEHFPNRLMQSSSFEVKRAREQAHSIGPAMHAYVSWQFDISRPLTALRRMQGVLRLHRNGIGAEAMEFAATQAKQFLRRDLRYFEQCAQAFQKRGGAGPRPAAPPRRITESLNLHHHNEGGS